MNMEGAKRTPLSARKKHKRKSKRLVRSIVTYLKSDAYLYAPLFSDLSPLPPQIHTPPPSNSESSKAEDLPVAAGTSKITNLVTMEVSTMREDNRNLRSDTADHALHNGRISSSKRSLVILDGQRTGRKRR
ncbi:PREDICTED: uncharacterized protein LOC106316835 isoform X2 [Brassica oleracea var. oleracea]|uniref:uncharacterized protein LOC106316835 isoform X2 n=1 Tax=Brassica oleracea var. oleracea TaxID=109376 RepID=UPI0006A6C067|nr:PREDICTED: uncharacterized protein LOC106316835 isoform X2 [Brassica oleracea var. oleracea]